MNLPYVWKPEKVILGHRTSHVGFLKKGEYIPICHNSKQGMKDEPNVKPMKNSNKKIIHGKNQCWNAHGKSMPECLRL